MKSIAAGEDAERSPATIQTLSAPSPPTARAGRRLRDLLRRPGRAFRRALFRDIQRKIDHAQASLQQQIDQAQASLQQQVDYVRGTLETLREALAAFRSDADRHTVALAARVDAVETRLDELALRVRTPIEVDDATMAVRTADGFVLVPRSDTTLLLMLYDAGPQGLEPGTRRLLNKLLAPGMTFVDVGADVGLLTLAGAGAVGPQGRVLALEPTPITFDLLTRGLAINGLTHRVGARCVACGARRERRAFHVATILGHSSLLEPAPESSKQGVGRIEVDVVPLDDVVPAGARVDVVKIDVEGAELDVLAGMTRIRGESPDIAIIAEYGPAHLGRAGITPAEWFEAFHKRGLEGYAIDELSGKCEPIHQRDLAAVDLVNILFCRPNSPAVARAKS